MENFEINTDKIEQAAELLKAVSHDVRLKILKLIHQKREVNVNVIYNTLKIEQSITSQHLKMLRSVNAVISRRDGKKIYYTVNYDRLDTMQRGIDMFEMTAKPVPKKSKK